MHDPHSFNRLFRSENMLKTSHSAAYVTCIKKVIFNHCAMGKIFNFPFIGPEKNVVALIICHPHMQTLNCDLVNRLTQMKSPVWLIFFLFATAHRWELLWGRKALKAGYLVAEMVANMTLKLDICNSFGCWTQNVFVKCAAAQKGLKTQR